MAAVSPRGVDGHPFFYPTPEELYVNPACRQGSAFRQLLAVAMRTSLAPNCDALVSLRTKLSLWRGTQICRNRAFAAAKVDFVPLVIEVGTPVHKLEVRQTELRPAKFMFATRVGLQILRVDDLVQTRLLGSPFHFRGCGGRDELSPERSAKQSSRLYSSNFDFSTSSGTSSHCSRQTMLSSPDAPTLVQRNPKKPAISFKLLEVVGK